jgi:hypothetical protein
MTNALSLVQAAHQSSDLNPPLYSDHMLSELLALHDQMVVQLRREHLGVIVIASYLTGEIDRHEKAAALLRAQSGNPSADTVIDGMVIITRQDSSDVKKSPAVRRPGASAHYFTRTR